MGNVVRPRGKAKPDKMSSGGYLRGGKPPGTKIVGRPAGRKKMR